MRNPNAPKMQDPIWPSVIIMLDAVMAVLFTIYMLVLVLVTSF